MNRSTLRNKTSLFFFATATAGLALVVACSSSDEAAPTRTLSPAPSSTGDTTPDAAVPDGATPDANACFEGEPSAVTDFLNACSDGQCAPFDNAARLPLFKPGQPLPPIP